MASTHRDEISRLELLHAAHPEGLVFPHLADAYRRAGRYAQAESVLAAGLRRHADYSSAHVVLGRLRLDQGQRDEARSAFQRVLQLDPQNQIALDQLARMTAEEGHTVEALDLLRKLQRIKPGPAVEERIRELQVGGEGGAPTTSDESRARPADRPPTVPHVSAPAAPPPSRPRRHAPPAGEGRRAGGNGGAGVPPRLPEPGEVVTETMAELYARQGLHDRAAAVYRQLLQSAPGDARLRAKLDLVENHLRAPRTGASRPPAVPRGEATSQPTPPRSASAAPPPPPAAPRAPSPVTPSAPPPPATPPEPPAAARSEPHSPGDRWRGERAGPPGGAIGTELRSLLSWTPPRRRRDAAVADVVSGGGRGSPWDSALLPGQEGDEEEPVRPGAAAGEDRLAAEAPVERAGAAGATGAAGPVLGPGLALDDGLGRLEGAGTQMRALLALSDLLVGLLEYRDPFFRGSSSLTRLLATSVGEEMGLSAEEQVDLALAAVLRDLGRLALGGRLLPVPRLNPTGESRRKIERHVDLALRLLEGIELPPAVRQAVRHHHERWDGAGYPDALARENIPVLARILAVVDSFTAMVSPRPYRLPRRVPDAAQELREEAGTRYDPSVVDALVHVIERREQPHLGFVQRHHILLVNADQPGAVVTAAKLCTSGYLAEVMGDAAAARERLRRVPVAALVVSADLGEAGSTDFVRDLRADPAFGALPIVVVDAEGVALRVRLLESGADVCFPPGISYAELQGTLGALVRRTLRSRPEQTPSAGGESTWLALQGDIQDFPLTWLLQVMKYDSRTAAIGIRTGSEEGAIYLRQGDAVHAEIRRGGKGEPALRQMLQWRKGRFTVQPEARPREQTIQSSIMHLLLTQAVAEDHAAAGIFGAVSEG